MVYSTGRLGWDRCDLGVVGGVRGNVTQGGDDDDGISIHDLAVRTVGTVPHPIPFLRGDDDGDLNVMPMALWRPIRSRR